GGAMAGALAALPAPGLPDQSAVADAVADAAPHGDCAGRGQGHAAADQEAPASDCHSGGSDCSDTPQCRQACMHAAVAVVPLLAVGVVESRVDVALHRLDAGHPAPVLPSA